MPNPYFNNKKVINGWAFFDWANSAYSLVISTAIFPIYFISITSDQINMFGGQVSNSAFYSFLVSFSYIVVAFFSPLLAGISDYGDKRMFFLRVFTTVGSISCVFLFFFRDMSDLIIGSVAFAVATMGHAASLVFYDAYLPEIVSEDRMDKVSAKGYAYGYFGSVLLLLFIIFLSQKPGLFGIPEDTSIPYRIGFALVGIWWISFSQITFNRLPKGSKSRMDFSYFIKGYRELKMVVEQLKSRFNLQRFLISFFFYSAGVQTVIYLATVFAEKELSFGTSELILIVLILQLVAIVGAFTFAQVSKIKGNKFALMFMIIIWIIICFGAYFVESQSGFYGLAALVGMVLGGIQAISRSSYSKLLGKNPKDLASYFSFYDMLYYLSIVFGTFAFGLVDQITQNLRYSVLVLAVFFIIGLLILASVSFKNKINLSHS